MPAVLRLVLILALACAPAVDVEVCASPCSDDDAEGACPPACADCVTCTHAPMFEVSGIVGGVAAADGLSAIPEAGFSAPQVDPRKVRHVPKAGTASLP